MSDQAGEGSGGMPWGILGGLLAFGALLAAGYFIIT